jgi:putative redox protein
MNRRELFLQVGGVSLRGEVLYPGHGGPFPAVVVCHGIPSGRPSPGDTGYRALAGRFLERGIGTCLFNFRGTGLSGGNFSLPGWMEDLNAVLDLAQAAEGPFSAVDTGRLGLLGFSGGGAVAVVCAAGRKGLRAVATMAAPSDFSRLIRREDAGAFIRHARDIGIIRDPDFPPDEEEYYRGMHRCRPARAAAALSPTPLLVVHGDGDETVPVEEARILYEAAGEPKELYIVRGAGHKLRMNEAAVKKAVSWLAEKLLDAR